MGTVDGGSPNRGHRRELSKWDFSAFALKMKAEIRLFDSRNAVGLAENPLR